MTAEEFLVWEAPDRSPRWELVDGVPIRRKPATVGRSRLVGEALSLLHNHLRGRRPLEVWLGMSISPDICNIRTPALTVSAERPGRDAMLLREPMMIVEILAPSDRRRVWDNIMRCTVMPSLAEALVLHRDQPLADVMRRGAGEAWDKHPVRSGDDLVELTSIGFGAPLDAFYR